MQVIEKFSNTTFLVYCSPLNLSPFPLVCVRDGENSCIHHHIYLLPPSPSFHSLSLLITCIAGNFFCALKPPSHSFSLSSATFSLFFTLHFIFSTSSPLSTSLICISLFASHTEKKLSLVRESKSILSLQSLLFLSLSCGRSPLLQ